MWLMKQKIKGFFMDSVAKLPGRLLTLAALVATAFGTVWAIAAFTEPTAGPAASVQDFAKNILGANNADNAFDSSAVAANKDGSLIERMEYMQQKLIDPPFVCGTSTVTDSRDNTVYNTVSIGTQCWMKQNMRVGTRINAATAQSNNGAIEKYCYSDTDANCTSNNPNQPDGGLYTWNEAMQYSTTAGAQGICPSGWHIPTDTELYVLENAVDSSINNPGATGWRGTDGGTKLKAGGSSGFEGSLAGYANSGSFNNRGTDGLFWSSSESGTDAWTRYLHSGYATVYRNTYAKSYAFSVRCLKDS
jgi:uncharacterized protein (TIGR02145 family)